MICSLTCFLLISYWILKFSYLFLIKLFCLLFIEKLFLSYRDTFSDSKDVLNKYSLGIAHNKVLHILSTYEGITIGELLTKLHITKQSLNRVLRDLIKSRMIKQIQDKYDTRKKNLFLDKEGKIFFETVYNSQK